MFRIRNQLKASRLKGSRKWRWAFTHSLPACPRPSSLPACHFTGNKSFVFKLEVAGEGVIGNFILNVNVAERNCKSSLFFLNLIHKSLLIPTPN